MTVANEHPDVDQVAAFLKQLQIQCCDRFQEFNPELPFHHDRWTYETGGGGITRMIENGQVFEKGGVNFSHIKGNSLPDAATASRDHIAGKPFAAAGVSVVMHPLNPFVPSAHMNVRFFIADPESSHPVWWFGGGYDLTPYYGFAEDCKHWHQTAKSACDKFDPDFYDKFKAQCDQYFFITHRNEPRGIGGLFFDDFNEPGFTESFSLMQSVGNSFLDAYMPIVERRRHMKYNDANRRYQCYRRGRYVEFNLIYDRGTIFGLQSEGRTESILMSMPPAVEWHYNWQPQPGSEEENLIRYYLKPRDWAKE
ncbi:oxygen-dependent coproporphyrinogen oxidase [Candidatus Spongiihabitans sp.]|uniref:oxygen-dependent coproporphyrinogen oxidase n=1 Tax=Candidatus Spongiihabitans sp. TaxID=3101308 RepID=UPI003C7B34D3